MKRHIVHKGSSWASWNISPADKWEGLYLTHIYMHGEKKKLMKKQKKKKEKNDELLFHFLYI